MAKNTGAKAGDAASSSIASETKHWKQKYRRSVAKRKILKKECTKKIKELTEACSDRDRIIKELTEACSDRDRIIKETTKALDMARSRLDVVDNAQKPTSHQMFKEMRKDQAKEEKADKGNRKPGRPVGHKGDTDTRPCTHTVRAKFTICKCGGRWIRATKETEREIIDVPKVVYTKTKMVSVAGTCVGCGKEVKGEFRKGDIESISGEAGVGGADAEADGSGGRVVETGSGKADAEADGSGGRVVETGSGLLQVTREDGTCSDVVEAEAVEGKEVLDVPAQGKLGFNLLFAVLMQWFHRGTIRGILDIVKKLYGLGLSSATIWSALGRIARGLEPEYDSILDIIMQSPYIHIDETSFYVKGVRKWVWIVATRERVYYFVDTRKIGRIKKILKVYGGVIIVDGYHTYKLLDGLMVQRCTAHMERDLKRWAKMEELLAPEERTARDFAALVRQIILDARDAKEAGRGPEMYDEMCARLDEVIRNYRQYDGFQKQVNKVANAGHRLFTFMKYPYVDSTNNLAERCAREIVKHRAIKSTFRTDEGAAIFAILVSIFMTHKGTDTDITSLLKKYL